MCVVDEYYTYSHRYHNNGHFWDFYSSGLCLVLRSGYCWNLGRHGLLVPYPELDNATPGYFHGHIPYQ